MKTAMNGTQNTHLESFNLDERLIAYTESDSNTMFPAFFSTFLKRFILYQESVLNTIFPAIFSTILIRIINLFSQAQRLQRLGELISAVSMLTLFDSLAQGKGMNSLAITMVTTRLARFFGIPPRESRQLGTIVGLTACTYQNLIDGNDSENFYTLLGSAAGNSTGVLIADHMCDSITPYFERLGNQPLAPAENVAVDAEVNPQRQQQPG